VKILKTFKKFAIASSLILASYGSASVAQGYHLSQQNGFSPAINFVSKVTPLKASVVFPSIFSSISGLGALGIGKLKDEAKKTKERKNKNRELLESRIQGQYSILTLDSSGNLPPEQFIADYLTSRTKENPFTYISHHESLDSLDDNTLKVKRENRRDHLNNALLKITNKEIKLYIDKFNNIRYIDMVKGGFMKRDVALEKIREHYNKRCNEEQLAISSEAQHIIDNNLNLRDYLREKEYYKILHPVGRQPIAA
jgi:hypothetical protein